MSRVTTTRPPQNALGRRQHKLLLELGYELVSHTGGGHYRYEHQSGDAYDVSGTAYDRTAWQSFVSEMRKRHPASDHPTLRPRKSTRQPRPYRRRTTRTPISLLAAPIQKPAAEREPTPEIPRPGSPAAVAAGCLCPVFENNRGEGITGEPGVFVYAVGKYPCRLHLDEATDLPQRDDTPRCHCGNAIPRRKAGRPRKYCFSCRPSKWDHRTEEERERQRAHVRRWYSKHVKEAA